MIIIIIDICMCIHTYIHTCIHTYIHTATCMHACMHARSSGNSDSPAGPSTTEGRCPPDSRQEGSAPLESP